MRLLPTFGDGIGRSEVVSVPQPWFWSGVKPSVETHQVAKAISIMYDLVETLGLLLAPVGHLAGTT